jgi:hypothetical protein
VCQSGRYCAQQQQQQPKETHKSHKSKKETSPASGCVLFTCVHASPSILTRVVGGVGNNDFFMTSSTHCDAYDRPAKRNGTEWKDPYIYYRQQPWNGLHWPAK